MIDYDKEENTQAKPYIHSNALREGMNKSHRSISNTTIFCVVVLVLYAIAVWVLK